MHFRKQQQSHVILHATVLSITYIVQINNVWTHCCSLYKVDLLQTLNKYRVLTLDTKFIYVKYKGDITNSKNTDK